MEGSGSTRTRTYEHSSIQASGERVAVAKASADRRRRGEDDPTAASATSGATVRHWLCQFVCSHSVIVERAAVGVLMWPRKGAWPFGELQPLAGFDGSGDSVNQPALVERLRSCDRGAVGGLQFGGVAQERISAEAP